MIKKPTCFQSSNPRCINLILTNKKELFTNSGVFEVGIFDFHSFIVTSLKSQLLKWNVKLKLYQDYSSFTLHFLKDNRESNFKNEFITEYFNFLNVFLEVLHKHASIKKDLRFKGNLFITTSLRKAVMHMSKFKNLALFSITKEQMKIGKTIKKKETSL